MRQDIRGETGEFGLAQRAGLAGSLHSLSLYRIDTAQGECMSKTGIDIFVEHRTAINSSALAQLLL